MRYKNVPVSEATWERLRTYKMAGATFDEVVSELMKSVPLEVVADRVIREFYERSRTFKGRDWRVIMRKT